MQYFDDHTLVTIQFRSFFLIFWIAKMYSLFVTDIEIKLCFQSHTYVRHIISKKELGWFCRNSARGSVCRWMQSWPLKSKHRAIRHGWGVHNQPYSTIINSYEHRRHLLANLQFQPLPTVIQNYEHMSHLIANMQTRHMSCYFRLIACFTKQILAKHLTIAFSMLSCHIANKSSQYKKVVGCIVHIAMPT